MKHEDFKRLLTKRIDKIHGVLGLKAKEYSSDADRMHNFKRAAAMLQVTPEQALIGMFTKHMVSILDLVDDISKDRHARQETWEEKIGDAVNYLILLEGLVAERNNERFDREAHNEAHV